MNRLTRRTLPVAAVVLSTAFILPGTASADSTSAHVTSYAPSSQAAAAKEVTFFFPRSGKSQGSENRGSFTCHLKLAHVHKRTSSGKKTIGFKPKVTCNVKATKIELQSALYAKVHKSWSRRTQVFKKNNSGQSTLEDKKIGFHCNGSSKTSWYGRSQMKVDLAGEGISREAATAETSLDCGP